MSFKVYSIRSDKKTSAFGKGKCETVEKLDMQVYVNCVPKQQGAHIRIFADEAALKGEEVSFFPYAELSSCGGTVKFGNVYNLLVDIVPSSHFLVRYVPSGEIPASSLCALD
jgi:hypothetical protein